MRALPLKAPPSRRLTPRQTTNHHSNVSGNITPKALDEGASSPSPRPPHARDPFVNAGATASMRRLGERMIRRHLPLVTRLAFARNAGWWTAAPVLATLVSLPVAVGVGACSSPQQSSTNDGGGVSGGGSNSGSSGASGSHSNGGSSGQVSGGSSSSRRLREQRQLVGGPRSLQPGHGGHRIQGERDAREDDARRRNRPDGDGRHDGAEAWAMRPPP